MREKLSRIILILILIINSTIYAKVNPFEEQVEAPKAESKVIISDATIISVDPYKEYTPINPVKPGVDIEEYNQVDNYIIDLNTIDYRIKYFSPTYLNIKGNAESMYWMSFYARGGNDTLMYNFKNYTEEIRDAVSTFRHAINELTIQRNKLDRNDPEYATKRAILDAQIANFTKNYNDYNTLYYNTNKTIAHTKSMLGLNNSLYNIGNVDNNNQISFARRMITKNITSVVMTYMQLNSYTQILEKQKDLYYDMYLLSKKNYDLGLTTALDVSIALDSYETINSTYKSNITTLKNVKEQVAINLGYSISDLDNLVFKEPEVNFELIDNINFEEDKTRAYTSNSAYYSLRLNNKDKRLPQSTGEELLKKRQDYYSNKIIIEFDNIYKNLISKKLSYDSSMYLSEIYKINETANKRKYDSNLISELEYKGLEIQNLGNKLQIDTAKYDLINAYNNYYYAVLGDININ